MKDKYFIDTNVLVYTFDEDVRKRRRAQDLVGEALDSRMGVISTQVVQEFLSVATRKFSKTLSHEDAELYFDKVLSPLCEVFPSLDLFSEALNLHKKIGYSYYDSLIVAAAAQARCGILYSEDLQDGRKWQGVKIVNPFG